MNSRSRGFTLIEFGLALLCVILGALLALTLVARVRQHWRCDQFVTDLRAFSSAFREYRRHTAAWPAVGDSAVPPGMEAALLDTHWLKGSPFGGTYRWIAPLAGASRAVALTAFTSDFPVTLTRADLRSIDLEIDDGDLATGRFRTGFNGWPVYLVSENEP